MPFHHVCSFCKIDFVAPKRTAKYCSQSCCAKDHVDVTVAKNKARRKYPEIAGLNRRQVHYRQTNGKDSLRDVELRKHVLVALGGKCVCCGYDKDLRGLVLDHINGDGHEDRKRYGSKLFRHYSKNLEAAKSVLQVLCATCNQIKSIEQREHNRSRRVIIKEAA